MDWQTPEILYLILPLCGIWLGVVLYSNARRNRARQRFVDQQMSDRILPDPSPIRFWAKLLLQELAIVTGLIAIAGPRFGEQVEQIIPRGSDLYVLIDVSRSMLADDVVPSRLGRAKADVSSLLNRLEGERIGLIAFAGQAVVKCPLTVDYASFRRSLLELDPNSAPRGGTAIGDAIRKSLEVFVANSERDQAILLITDGDDQQSYPLEAASAAAERKVTIFAVGLGDSERGARIPQKPNSGTYVEHQGEQVWSKLDSSLLQDIALKTSGVYIPAGTRSYDLGELYTNYLQGRKGDDSSQQTRIRRAERFQIFLGIALVALLLDLSITPFKRAMQSSMTSELTSTSKPSGRVQAASIIVTMFASLLWTSKPGMATDSVGKVREGLKLYAEQKFEEAGQAFAEASSQLDKNKSPKSSVAMFDEACARHRKGDFDKAKDLYLQAGLSQDRELATAAHFNLGMLSSEQARAKAGDTPETIEKEKRQEIIDQLKQSIASYRHCLELNPKHTASRKNIELTRQWIKYYTDKWNELDRQKRRNETNLIQFLEYLMTSQLALRDSVRQLTSNDRADTFAEFKRIQDELAQELPVLKDKIDTELSPPKDSPNASASDPELEKGIKMLKDWADEAGNRMSQAASLLAKADPQRASNEQSAAHVELDRIWDAVVPFHPLLTKELAKQSEIAKGLGAVTPNQESPSENHETENHESEASEGKNDVELAQANTEATKNEDTSSMLQEIVIDDQEWSSILKTQEETLGKSRLLSPKAEAELEQMEKQPEAAPTSEPADAANPQQVDPEQVKAGYRKAIELAPKAVEAMEQAVEQIRKKDRQKSAVHAEEARRILQEIQDAQPKNPNQDQKNQDQQQNQDKQNPDQEKNEDKNQDKDKSQEENKQQEKKDQNEDKDKDKDKDKKQDPKDSAKPKPNQISKDRIEEALRKVREREQDKRDRDRELKAKALGRTPVDKDW
jgi:Ca-activated chloride channel homolog